MISKTYDQCVVDLLDPAFSAVTSFTNQIVIEGQGVKQVFCIQAGYFPWNTLVPQEGTLLAAIIVAEGKLLGDVQMPLFGTRNNFPYYREMGLSRIIKFLPIRAQGTQVFRFSDERPLRASQNAPLSIIQNAPYMYDSAGMVYSPARMQGSLQIDGETIQEGIEGRNKFAFKDLK